METSQLQERINRVKALFLDVDGILTDDSVYLGSDNTELKRFTLRDGVGVALARQAGLLVALISGRDSEATTVRARQMGIEHVYQGYLNKLEPFKLLLDKLNIEADEVVFIGDGLIDIPLMELVGVPVSVPNAHPLVKNAAVYITDSSGGRGVLMEVVEWILAHQGRFDKVVASMRTAIEEADQDG